MIANWKRTILIIWAGQSVSLLTSSVLQMSIIWYLSATTGSAAVVTMATLCAFFPQSILGSFTGVFVDRFSKKIILVASDLFIAAISGLLGLVALSGALPIPLIMVVLVFRSIGTAFHEPAAQSITPLIVPPDQLTQYAGYAQAFDSVCLLLSPAIASVMNNIFEISTIMFFDVVGAAFAVAILCVVALPAQETGDVKQPPLRIWGDTMEGIRILKGYPGILPLMAVGAAYSVIYSPVGSLYPHITMNYFGGTTDHSAFVEVVFSVGSLLGALLLGRIGGKLSKTKGMAGSMLIYGMGVLLIGLLPTNGYSVFVLLSFCMGLVIPFYHGINRAIYQIVVPQQYLGRAMALALSARRLGMPLGLIFGGLIADTIGINVLYAVAGAMAICLAWYVARMPALRAFYD